jgi:hypothetical protein
MKRTLLFVLILGMGLSIMAQQSRARINTDLMKIEKAAPAKAIAEEPAKIFSDVSPSVKPKLSPSETTIGETRYDLQTNTSVQNRFYRFSDGTMGATWTYGVIDGSFSDRGTGYNYFDGTSWGPVPTTRIEASTRTGWPSYAPWGAAGECVLAHTGGLGLAFNTRATKGSGAWTQTIYTYPAAHETYWPRMTTSGTNNDKVHLLQLTDPVANGGTIYQGLDGALLYSRSQDGGATWDIRDALLPGMTSTEYDGFGGDQYSWATPVGDNLAFVVGDNWTDLFVMKSTDGGTTWTKHMIFEHPYPMFKEATTLVLDTPWVCDGGTAIAMDASGTVHVSFGLMRVLNDDLTDGNTSYFPYTDGIAYWKEGDPAFDTLAIDSVDARGSLVAWMQDINQNDTIDFIAGDDALGLYYMSLNSMPNMTVDANGDVYVVWAGITEGKDNGIQMFRHLWGRARFAATGEWGPFTHLTSSIIHNFDECVFPSMAYSTDNNVHIIYQVDEEPGLHIRGDEDAPTDNSIVHSAIPKSDFGVGISERPSPISDVSQNFPNPFSGTTEVVVNLSSASSLSLEVSNMLGQTVSSQELGKVSPGAHSFTIDGRSLKSGVYFYTVHAGDHSVTKKMIVQ